MTEQALVDYVLERVRTLYPTFTHEQQLAYALGFLAAQVSMAVNDDNRYYYRVKSALNKDM